MKHSHLARWATVVCGCYLSVQLAQSAVPAPLHPALDNPLPAHAFESLSAAIATGNYAVVHDQVTGRSLPLPRTSAMLVYADMTGSPSYPQIVPRVIP
jgi:hypothetical protein